MATQDANSKSLSMTDLQCVKFQSYEMLLESDLCQSCIGGRNSSSACTIICVRFREMLPGIVSFDDDQRLIAAMCLAMKQGNDLYDGQALQRLLSVDEATAIFKELDMQMSGESFVRFSYKQW